MNNSGKEASNTSHTRPPTSTKKGGKTKSKYKAHHQTHHSAETSQQPNNISKKSVAMLWNRLSALYGGLWEKNSGLVGGDTYLAWESALLTLSEAHVLRGYDAVIAEANDFPPNLIKFLRLCRTAHAYDSHNKIAELPRPLPRYSVFRIEQAKQQILFGESFDIPKSQGKKHIMDWSWPDEDLLLDTLAQFTPESTLEEINAVVDHIEFSHGTQRNNAYET